ncbi:hypothetical protein SAMN05216474_1145 [Lishizhenia tianjinensis]|uniref:Lipoprotein n=1 Tax=Lishizhenia tianjinensis TaxID=477690 RepID=A0A1I6YST1_9FLAO|nr:hypothetical protein [Lishizhenia tianjinensis]SFT53497.1 hypothetical protein SAMN05216474_1145 [Lishizhenia tianjinensis]
MKYLTLLFTLPFLFACSKQEDMQLIKDCTGTYLRKNKKDLKVCNDEILTNYEENELITVVYERVEDCAPQQGFVCELYHEHEGYIVVESIY